MEEARCPLCNDARAKLSRQETTGTLIWECIPCGRFSITEDLNPAIQEGKYRDKHWILSGVISNATREVSRYFNPRTPIITYTTGKIIPLRLDNIEEYLQVDSVPTSPVDMMDRWLPWMAEVCVPFHMTMIMIAGDFYPLIFAKDAGEFQLVVRWIEEAGYIQHSSAVSAGPYTITRKGWERIAELKKVSRDSDQAFVATWFDDQIDQVYTDGIKPALVMHGYKPVWVKSERPIEKIDDHIMASIRRSGLVIADFTGNRQNVYYEAGFAKGLGIPVIWTCKDEHEHTDALGFDTRQYGHIFWKTTEDLCQQLADRIEANNLSRVGKA